MAPPLIVGSCVKLQKSNPVSTPENIEYPAMKLPFTPLIQALPATVPFVAPETIERDTGIPFQVRVGANESAFGISPKAHAAMLNALDHISRYNDPESHDLREALAGCHHTTRDHIGVGAGIDDLLGLAVRTFIRSGDVAVSSRGSYPTFHYHVAGFDGKSHTVPYLNGRNDLDALADAANKTNATLVYLANPDNPTGTWHTAADLNRFFCQLPPACVLILDEAYLEFAPRGTAFPIRNPDPRIILMRTFSKAHGMAGARVGYAIAAPEIITAFDKVRLHFNVNRVAQAGALASLGDRAFLQTVITAVEAGRNDYLVLAQSLGLKTLPSATNFVTFDCDTQPRAQAVLEALAQRGVFVRKPVVPLLDHYFRVTVGSPEERRAFAEILPKALAEAAATS